MLRPRNIALLVAAALILVSAFVLTCRERRQSPAGPLVVGTNLWPGYEPLHLARANGDIDETDVRLVDFAAPSQVRDAFRNGVLHAAAVTLDETLLLREHGFDVRVVLVLDISAGADGIVARPPRDELADLAGARVGVEHSTLGSLLLARALERAGLAVEDITVVHLQEHEQLLAYRDGRVDALATSDPVRTQVMALGASPLFDTRDLPGEVVDVLVVRADVLRARRSQVEALIRGWWRGVALLERDRAWAVERMARRLDMSAAQIEQSLSAMVIPDLQENLDMLTGDPSRLDASIARVARIMVESELLGELGPPPEFAEPGPLRRIQAEVTPP